MSLNIVSISDFLDLAGESLRLEVKRLLADPQNHHLVLFSDELGEHSAILAVGPTMQFRDLSEVAGQVIEGLRPLCAIDTPAAPAAKANQEQFAQLEQEWSRLRARQREIEQMEASLKSRERYVMECEKRLDDLGQDLAEREASLDHREQSIIAKEREFFRRVGGASRPPLEASQ